MELKEFIANFFNKILCKAKKIDFKNSPEKKICFFETEIWCA